MEGIVVVFGTIEGLAGADETSRDIQHHGGRGVAFGQHAGIVDGLDGGTGLARAKSDVDLTVASIVKIIFGADHSEDFPSGWFGD